MANRDPARPHLLIRMRGRRVARPVLTAGPGRHRPTRTNPAPAGGPSKETALMISPDANSNTPSKAELWIRYHRKSIIAAAPVLLAALNVLRDAAVTENGVNASTIVLAVLAAAQLVSTYWPKSATAKLVASAILAVGSGVTAAVTDGISSASLLLVGTQFLAWASAGVMENGARPDVAAAALGRPLPE